MIYKKAFSTLAANDYLDLGSVRVGKDQREISSLKKGSTERLEVSREEWRINWGKKEQVYKT